MAWQSREIKSRIAKEYYRRNPVMSTPLADRMRPATIEEYVGQEHLLKKGALLAVMLERKQLFSLILWGPPGTGKTTLARLLAAATKADFVQRSAVTSGLKDVREVVKRAGENQRLGQQTILFIDELHRFNKAQQDAFLPHVEAGTITLIGATTENPSFEVIAPLLSRCRVVRLEALTEQHLGAIIDRALVDKTRGLGELGLTLAAEAKHALIRGSGGDARTALNALELAGELAKNSGVSDISVEHVSEALQSKTLLYDRAGEEHYNTISAFIKAMRGSDANASLYYLSRMIKAGEDPLFIARRMLIFASEDVGLEDFRALLVATATFLAVERIGYPECQLTLAHAATYLANTKKSRSMTNALGRAMEAVEQTLDVAIPLHLRNAVTDLMKQEGYFKGYTWKDGKPKIEDKTKSYLPDELKDVDFFNSEQETSQ